MHAQTYTHISIFTLVCMQVLTHTNTLPHNLNSFVHVKRHVNINAFKWRDACECIIWQSLTYSISSPRKNKDRPSNAAAETHRLFNHWFLSQTEISILCCNASKDPFQIILNPRPTLPLPFVTQSQHHTSFICSTSLFSFPAPFKTVSPVSTFPTDCALTLQKSKGILSFLIIHVRWEAPASLHCKPRNMGFYTKCVYVCPCNYCTILCQCAFLFKA